MTAAVMRRDQRDAPSGRRVLRRRNAAATAVGTPPPLSPKMQVARAVLVLLAVFSGTLVLQLLVVSKLQHGAAQERKFDSLRARLAAGTAPTGGLDADGKLLALGTPVALIEIPSLDLREVVSEGTTAGVLFDGPGHRRDTPLPGQVGTSVLFGRRSTFGAPFHRLGELRPEDLIIVTTGQGTFEYRVTGLRLAGDPVPPSAGPSEGRLLLVTAAGSSFLPDGLLRVDAALDGDAVVGPTPPFASGSLPAAERAMAGDPGTLWALALWLQALIALSAAMVFFWNRWGRWQAWIVLLPPMVLVGLSASGEVARLLPNLS